MRLFPPISELNTICLVDYNQIGKIINESIRVPFLLFTSCFNSLRRLLINTSYYCRILIDRLPTDVSPNLN